MLKRFMYAAIGVLALAVAFHFGATTATGQGTGRFVAITYILGGPVLALTDGGDVWSARWDDCSRWTYCGTIGGGVAVEPSTWGQVKHRAGQ